MIAAIARTFSDCIVVSNDRDFARVPGVSVVDWGDPQNGRDKPTP